MLLRATTTMKETRFESRIQAFGYLGKSLVISSLNVTNKPQV